VWKKEGEGGIGVAFSLSLLELVRRFLTREKTGVEHRRKEKEETKQITNGLLT